MVSLSPIGNAAQALAGMLQARPADPPSPGEVRETLEQLPEELGPVSTGACTH